MEAFLDIHCCSCAFFHPPLVVLITTLGVLRYHTSNCRAVDRRDVTRHKLLHTPPIDLFVRRASFFRQRMSYCKSSTTGELPRSSPQKSLLIALSMAPRSPKHPSVLNNIVSLSSTFFVSLHSFEQRITFRDTPIAARAVDCATTEKQ
jgi:hypothetical protein